MDVFSRMVGTQALLFLFVLLGVIVRKAGIITPASRGSFNLFLLNVTLPAMILASFLGEVSLRELGQAWVVLAVSLLSGLGAFLLGRLLWRGQEEKRRSVLRFGTMFSNAGGAGTPVVTYLFGAAGTFYAAIYLIPVRVMMWTLGVSLFSGPGGRGRWRGLLLSPAMLAVFLGLPLMIFGLRLPEVVQAAVRQVGDITGPLSMILIGTILAEIPLRQAFCREAFLLAGLRLVLLPLLLLGLLRLLGADPLVASVTFLIMAMPVASNTVMISERYGGDSRLASQCVFLSTVLSLFTVPLLTLLLQGV